MDKALARGFARTFLREVQAPQEPVPNNAFSALHKRGKNRRIIRPKDFKALTDSLKRSMRHPSVIEFRYRPMHEGETGYVFGKRLVPAKSNFVLKNNNVVFPLRRGDETSLLHFNYVMICTPKQFDCFYSSSDVSTGEHAIHRWFMRSLPSSDIQILGAKASGPDVQYRRDDLCAELYLANCFAQLAVAAVKLYGLEKLAKHRTLDLPLPTPTGVFRSHAMLGASDPMGLGFRMLIDKNYGNGNGSFSRVKPYKDGETRLDVHVNMRTFLSNKRLNCGLRRIYNQLLDWNSKYREMADNFHAYRLGEDLVEFPESVRHGLRDLYDIFEPGFSRPSRWGELIQPEVDRLAAWLESDFGC